MLQARPHVRVLLTSEVAHLLTICGHARKMPKRQPLSELRGVAQIVARLALAARSLRHPSHRLMHAGTKLGVGINRLGVQLTCGAFAQSAWLRPGVVAAKHCELCLLQWQQAKH